jgi:pilus assembly protein Flp/PilA
MIGFVRRFFRASGGATAIEYGLIAAMIAVVIVAAVGSLGTSVSGKFNTVANATQ